MSEKRRTTHPRRQERRTEAAVRAEARSRRSTHDQIKLISQRRGESRREFGRLIAAQNAGSTP